jgi:hypothetical protein
MNHSANGRLQLVEGHRPVNRRLIPFDGRNAIHNGSHGNDCEVTRVGPGSAELAPAEFQNASLQKVKRVRRQFHISHSPDDRWLEAGKRDVRLLSHHAMATVTAHQISGRQFVTAGFGSNLDCDGLRILTQPNYLVLAGARQCEGSKGFDSTPTV